LVAVSAHSPASAAQKWRALLKRVRGNAPVRMPAGCTRQAEPLLAAIGVDDFREQIHIWFAPFRSTGRCPFPSDHTASSSGASERHGTSFLFEVTGAYRYCENQSGKSSAAPRTKTANGGLITNQALSSNQNELLLGVDRHRAQRAFAPLVQKPAR
jgi:hypothetical protein